MLGIESLFPLFSASKFQTFIISPASHMASLKSLISLFFVFFIIFSPANAAGNPAPSPQNQSPKFTPFRPSVAVIVGVLTTMFSFTFLLLLYAKHCKRGDGAVLSRAGAPYSPGRRKNSGIDRAVIESLPIFRFASLMGQKDGLECAVCLTRFEPTEVLRLLPKCKHAFHVECVDTWLDAHSTCPLCRYRVDPEDILLVEDVKILYENQPVQNQDGPLVIIEPKRSVPELEIPIRIVSISENRRISGRHSSAGERGSRFIQTGLQKPRESESETKNPHDPTSFRRSLDSMGLRKKSESVAVGCFDRPRKDGLLLNKDKTSFERRFEHQIIVSGGFHQRWSDVHPSDLLYLRSEMIISDGRRFSSASGSRPSVKRQQQHENSLPLYFNNSEGVKVEEEEINGNKCSGRSAINSRSVSEISGLSRFSSSNTNNNRHRSHSSRNLRERQDGVVSRWMAWISQSRPDVRSELGCASAVGV